MAGRVWILQAGRTYASLAATKGDFDAWIDRGLGLPAAQVGVIRVFAGEALPDWEAVAGVVVSGAHEMVTDHLPWSEALAAWLAEAVRRERPVLGICYGHQLLAYALGGRVGNNPRGSEFGTTEMLTTQAARTDALFGPLPARFPAHVCHAQSVLELPPGATLLAANAWDPHQAFMVGRRAWGVQFHPEFDEEAIGEYLHRHVAGRTAANQPVGPLFTPVRPTEASADLLRQFGRLCV